ncbi:MAG TPA: hypothetical protein QF597_08270, partial [Arenicellales bacterium]|nr:hypothetical protein [Arenicellales bacterium]
VLTRRIGAATSPQGAESRPPPVTASFPYHPDPTTWARLPPWHRAGSHRPGRVVLPIHLKTTPFGQLM